MNIKNIKAGTKKKPKLADISNKKTKKKINKKKAMSKGSKKGRPATHGLSNTPTYRSWRNAKQRCENPNQTQYKDYGGRGIECRITVIDLVDEIGLRPDGSTLDRIDPDGHYEKGNIQWATPIQQARNRRPPRSSEFYRQQAIQDIERNHMHWAENARWWNLSIKLINYGRLSDAEQKELASLSRGSRLPRTSFELDEPRDWGHHEAGKIRLPSLTRPGDEVRIICGPVGTMRKKSEIKQGLLVGMAQVPLSYNSDESHRVVIKQFVNNFKNKSMMGLRFNACDFDPEIINTQRQSPERLFLALAARLHLKGKWNVRVLTMSDLTKILEVGNTKELFGSCLFIPDFHVSGPRGFGLLPWLVNDLLELLRERISVHNPTVIYAEAPETLGEEIYHFIIHNYLKISR